MNDTSTSLEMSVAGAGEKDIQQKSFLSEHFAEANEQQASHDEGKAGSNQEKSPFFDTKRVEQEAPSAHATDTSGHAEEGKAELEEQKYTNADPSLIAKSTSLDYDVLVIGAGIAGIYASISMKKLGLRIRVLERGAGVGGTWFWNRYPGARVDSESYIYMFTFSQELMEEWDFKEHYTGQEDNLRYLNHIVDKFDVRSNIQLETDVKSAHYHDEGRFWSIVDQHGKKLTARFLINCLGPLTNPTLPEYPGVGDFKGEGYHTARWPAEPVGFEGKRVGIIGTGASGIQVAQEVAKTAKSLTIFQRTPNWTAPIRNDTIDKQEMKSIRERYPEIIKMCRTSPANFMYSPDPRSALKVTPEEREALWESHYSQRGLIKVYANFHDVFVNQEANNLYAEWMAKKIRARVHNSIIADKLIPKDHGFGLKRVPLEHNYYEIFNQPNVKLVDLLDTPIERITENGVKTTSELVELDMLIYATGFDSITGSYEAIDYYGEKGISLQEEWKDGPRTYLGLMVPKFPNMFNVAGPQQGFGNMVPVLQFVVDWVTKYVQRLVQTNKTYVAPQEEAVEKWVEHVLTVPKGLLNANVKSWLTGYNSNRGKSDPKIIRYFGSGPMFRKHCDDAAAANYQSFIEK